MQGWLGNGNVQKIKLKQKERGETKNNWATIKEVKVQNLEEIDETNEKVYENPFKTKLIIPRKNNEFLNESENMEFLFKELPEFEHLKSIQEKDELWEFKTLKNEISAIVTNLYGETKKFVI
jgi:hypothetical protein